MKRVNGNREKQRLAMSVIYVILAIIYIFYQRRLRRTDRIKDHVEWSMGWFASATQQNLFGIGEVLKRRLLTGPREKATVP